MKKHNLFKSVLALVLALVLVATSVSAISVKADETPTAPAKVEGTQYDPLTDTITNTSKTIIYVLKKEKDNTIKAGAECFEAAANAKVSLTTDLNVKGTTKDVYLYVCDKEFEAEGKSIQANMVIKAQAAKKVVGTVDYTKSDDTSSVAVLGATATDANKKAIESVTVLWSAEKDGTYAKANESTGGFTGAMLNAKLAEGGVIYIKMLGVEGPTGTAVRTSQAYKVKIAKQGKAPKVKLDVKKTTISIKNGLDFGIAFLKEGKTDEYEAVDWFTVLPTLKDATNKATDIIATTQYLPADKKNDTQKKAVLTSTTDTTTKLSFTQSKVKEIALSTIVDLYNKDKADEDKISLSDGFTVAVRTSATDKKPASAVSYNVITGQAEAPQIYTVENVLNYTTIAAAAKLEFKTPTIVNYVSAWKGIGSAAAASTESGVKSDTAAAKYEVAVIKAADLYTSDGAEEPTYELDLSKIDWSTVGWKSIKEGTKLNEKTKTKYALVGKTASDVVLKQSSSEEVDYTKDIFVVIRRAGVKGKTNADTIIASDLLVTRVYKVDKTYVWSIVDEEQALVGEAAENYVIKVKEWDAETKTYEDNGTTISKYIANTVETKEVALTAVEGAKYFDSENTEITKVTFSDTDPVTVTLKSVAKITVNGTAQTGTYYVGAANVAITLPTTPTGKKIGSVKVGTETITDDDNDGVYKIELIDATEITVTVEFVDDTPAVDPGE